MIDIEKLSPADIGRWVTYCIRPPATERGRIKSWSQKFIYVVFHCGGNWDHYADYTAAPTLPEHLE